jgi:hypothetical protein
LLISEALAERVDVVRMGKRPDKNEGAPLLQRRIGVNRRSFPLWIQFSKVAVK